MNNRDLLNAYMCAIEMRENASSSQQYDELGEEMDRLCEEILSRMGGEEMSNEKSGVDEYEEMYCDVCGGTVCFC